MRVLTFEDRDAPFVRVFERTARAAGAEVVLLRPAGEPAGFAKLKRHYRHLSANSVGFELACFRRWFEIAATVGADERFIQADSDIVFQRPLQDLPAIFRDAEGVVGSIGVTDGIPETQVSPGFSLWTGRLLAQFCDYLVAVYERGADDLAALHAAGGGSISDMTLIYRWLADDGVAFTDSNRVIEDGYIDHNIFMQSCGNADFRMQFGRKRLGFGADGARLQTTDGRDIRPLVLHLVGRYKLLAEAIEQRDATALAARSLYIAGGKAGRSALASVGVRL